ncbi:MAG: DUF1801 domain-containing protein [Chitinophagales bacterium]
MAKNKTIETKNSVVVYLKAIRDEKKRIDFSEIINLITKGTGLEAKMWGTSIVGFGNYHYKYESGREGEAPLMGIAARANAIVLYLSGHFDKREELLSKFGKYKTDKGCVYIQKLEDIDKTVLVKMIKNSIDHKMKLYPG